MPSIKVKNFKYGLDSRRSEVEAQPGTLVTLENAHINQGGEIEGRLAFVQQPLPVGTFGAQATSAGIVTFGSAAPMAAADGGGSGLLSAGVYQYKVTLVTSAGEYYNSMGYATVTLAASHKGSLSGIPLGPSGTTARKIYRTVADGAAYKLVATLADNTTTVYTDNIADASLGATLSTSGFDTVYQRLIHPDGSTAMTAITASECFGGNAFAVATFSDGYSFPYYNGSIVKDFTNGLVLPYLNTIDLIVTHLAGVADDVDNYEGSNATATISNATNNGSGLIRITLSTSQEFATGQTINISGVTGTTEANGNWTVTKINATTLDLQGSTFVNAYTGGPGTVTWKEQLIIEGDAGVDFTLAKSTTSAAGTISTPSVNRSAVAAKAGVSAVASFRIVAGQETGASVAATGGKITRSATTPTTATDYVLVGNKRYTFKTTPTVEGDVKINGSAAAALTNLAAAIMHTGTPGTDYVCALAHPMITAAAIVGSDLNLTPIKGFVGNSIRLTASVGAASWTTAAFSGGSGNCIASISVFSTVNAETRVLGAAGTVVEYDNDPATTAAAVVTAINAYTGTSGYHATSDGPDVFIYSADTASPMPNGYVLQIVVGGKVLCGNCMFYVKHLTTASFYISQISAGGLMLSANVTYPDTVIDTLAEYYAALETAINTDSTYGSGKHGIVALAEVDFIRLARVVTRSDDAALTVNVTVSSATDVEVTFGTPPSAATPLSATVQGNAGEVANEPVSSTGGDTVVLVTVVGGIPPYTYDWKAETASAGYPDSYVILPGASGTAQVLVMRMVPDNSGVATALLEQYIPIAGGIRPGTYTGRFICVVTDSNNAQVATSSLTVTFVIIPKP